MGIDKNAFKSKSEEYETPKEIFEPLQKEFQLELDVCATKENTKCELFLTKEEDALTKNWNKNFWKKFKKMGSESIRRISKRFYRSFNFTRKM